MGRSVTICGLLSSPNVGVCIFKIPPLGINREFAWEPPGHVRSLFAVRKQRWWLSCGFLVAFDFVGKADAAPNVHGA